MLVENQIFDVKITKKNIDTYKSAGYNSAALGKIISVRAEDLTKGSHQKVKVQCDYCGKIIDVAYKDYVRYKFNKYSCARCRQAKTSEYNLQQRQKSLYDRALSVCKEKRYMLLTPINEIKNANTRVKYVCPKHDVQETKIYTLILGHGCSDCAYEFKAKQAMLDCEEVYSVFAMHDCTLLNKEEYSGWSRKNLQVICPECGNVFITSYGTFIHEHGQRCPNCTSNESCGERAVRNFLESNDIKYTAQYRIDDCRNKAPLPFDFFLDDLNILIEYDGAGHYIPIPRGGMSLLEAADALVDIKHRDAIKNQYCEDHNIRLIRIPYWDFDNIESILNNELHEDIV